MRATSTIRFSHRNSAMQMPWCFPISALSCSTKAPLPPVVSRFLRPMPVRASSRHLRSRYVVKTLKNSSQGEHFMKAKPVLETKVNREDLTTADLFRLANESVDRLGVSEGGRLLFPNGFESIDLSVQAGSVSFSLNLKGAQTPQAAALPPT